MNDLVKFLHDMADDAMGMEASDRLILGEAADRIDEQKAEIDRLKLKLFYPVNEDAELGKYRKNFVRLSMNFEALGFVAAMRGVELLAVNVGEYPGDATGDTFRDAWIKVNENFAKIEKAVEVKQNDES
jgi:hypothetical protein